MFEIATRRRPYVLLAFALLSQVLLLAVQIRRPDGARLIRVWAVELMTPVERAGSWALDEMSGAWSGYIGLFHEHRENQHLRAQVGELMLRNSELESHAAEAQRLAALLQFQEAHTSAPLLAARVIGSGAGDDRSIYVDRGLRDGVQPNLGVITPEGVVGKVLKVYSTTAQVLLLTDKNSGAGALLEKSRTQGAAKGSGDPVLLLDYVINDQEVVVGERVLTSGIDQIFPKDLPLGTVTEVRNGNPFKVIRVRPAARLDRMEEVFILLSRQQWEWLNSPGTEDAGAAANSSAPAKKGSESATTDPRPSPNRSKTPGTKTATGPAAKQGQP
jgi:rod shape-determining protein MreC